ncbi:hypothetical protein NM688_g1063 [Phlebia brevispora]|uniref:Uncharacterized protein n=1 Tax=Phlebia brevispora TaxID=194682 RepID=A0ACC1TCE8_9APHY|nr:hypothetical protein NM688_g1063 [Phlebia brevispora]
MNTEQSRPSGELPSGQNMTTTEDPSSSSPDPMLMYSIVSTSQRMAPGIAIDLDFTNFAAAFGVTQTQTISQSCPQDVAKPQVTNSSPIVGPPCSPSTPGINTPTPFVSHVVELSAAAQSDNEGSAASYSITVGDAASAATILLALLVALIVLYWKWHRQGSLPACDCDEAQEGSDCIPNRRESDAEEAMVASCNDLVRDVDAGEARPPETRTEEDDVRGEEGAHIRNITSSPAAAAGAPHTRDAVGTVALTHTSGTEEKRREYGWGTGDNRQR